MPYEFLSHTADVRIAITAATWPDLVREATGVVRLLVSGDSTVHDREQRSIEATGGDPAAHLLTYMRELVFWFSVDRFIPSGVHIDNADPRHLRAVVHGEVFDAATHETQPEVKAVTRHGFSVTESPTGWRAEVVFDV